MIPRDSDEPTDPVLDAAALVVEANGWVGTALSGILVYEWIADDGQPAIGVSTSADIRMATMLGLLEWAKSHVIQDMLDIPELE